MGPAAPAAPAAEPDTQREGRAAGPSNLALRVATSLVAAPLALGAAWIGGWAWGALIAAVALAAQFEVYGLMRRGGAQPLVPFGLALGALAALRALVPAALPLLAAGGVFLLLVAPFRRSETPLLDLAGTLFGAFYPALLLGFAVTLREAGGPDIARGFGLTAAVLFAVWGADTFAYAAGRALGRHPLFPRVSPKKTWEGAVGGALGSLAVAAVFKTLWLPFLGWTDVLAIGLACGVASQLGDLAESLFKRAAGVKDSGGGLPGHGGMLDRLDAATVAIPLVTLYLDHVAGAV